MSQDKLNQHGKLPVKPLLNPLGPDDEAAIDAILSQIPITHDLLARCEACGMDVTEHRARHDMHKVIAERIKAHFFPPQLPALD